ncbi:unnamed protein product [Eruca vesicaria subsp. sativa]|uniref:Uncharacterized protein n=1 Tax=Eruca vesicaria subsp. sativa TaxID=29727 RepID=A0ABC8KI48_ERUVS|nr:unnamed protein product [Eruca vesicaria subsp. sativa]
MVCSIKFTSSFSSSNKLHEFISSNTTTKEIIDPYHTASGVDVWSAHCEECNKPRGKLLDTSRNLRPQINQKAFVEKLSDYS